MTKDAILHRARLEQRRGNAGSAIRLHILAREAKTIQFGDERQL